MSDIKMGFDIPFTQVPNDVIQDADISPDAFAIWTYLHSKPDGWVIRPKEVQKRWKMSDHRWRKAAAELKAMGLFEYEYRREGGKIMGKIIRLARYKPTESADTVTLSHRNVVSPHYGDTEVRSDNTYTNKEKDINKEKDTKRGASNDAPPARRKQELVDPLKSPIPANVDEVAWLDWVAYRASKRKPINTKQTITKTFNHLARFTPEQQRRMVDYSIRGEYSGLYDNQAESQHEKDRRNGKDNRTRAEFHADNSGNWEVPGYENETGGDAANGLLLRSS